MTAVREIMRPVLSHVLRSPFDPSISGLEGAVRYLLTEKYASAPAAWYDAQDFSTMFQDVAMTIPAALEQPVAIQLDKSGRGWHRSQATASKRPKLSRRYNRWTDSEFTLGLASAPIRSGLVTATTMSGYLGALQFGSGTDTYAYASGISVSGPGVFSCVVEIVGGAPVATGGAAGGTDLTLVIGGNPVSAMATPLSGDRYLVKSATTSYSGGNVGIVKYATNTARSFKATAYSFVAEADASLPYQRVTSASDYDTDQSKFPAYLSIDGVDDCYVTATQTGWDTTSAVSFFAALQREAGTTLGVFTELGLDATSNPAWSFRSTANGLDNTQFISRGSGPYASTFNSGGSFKGVFVGRANILAPSVQTRFNGVAGAAVTTTQGAGPYANNPVYWFARNQTVGYFKGNAFGQIVLGAQMLDAEVALIEKYLAMKAGVTL